MKIFLSMFILFVSSSVFALDPYVFSCVQNGITTQSVPGVKKAPVSPVVNLNIKVLKNQVQLFMIKATTSDGKEKSLFATDWVAPSELSPDGENLFNLLGLFYPVNMATLAGLRAALPTDLLDGFAYLELKDQSGSVLKLAFQGTSPSTCQ
jgi:hypothetical protein